jgi:hypothetical protein
MKQLQKTSKLLRGCLFAASILSFAACGALKKAPNGGSLPTKKDKTQPTQQGSQGTVLVDTVRWKIDPKSKPPIQTSGGAPQSGTSTGTVITDNGSTNSGGGVVIDNGSTNSGSTSTGSTSVGGTKSSYDLTLVLPFFSSQFVESSGQNPPKGQFALDFYAGVRLALDSLSTMPIRMKVNVLDSKNDFNAVLAKYEVSKTDVILGPVEKENVPVAMDWAKRNRKIVVSPYFPTGELESANPNFIQVKPSLKTHCENIVRHIRSRVSTEQVVLVGRQRDAETGRFKYFQDANSSYNSSQYGGRMDEWAIEDETDFTIEPYIRATGQTIFILPSWNEAFVGSFLKKLAASTKKNSVVVYGMPQWMDFDRSLTSLYESLKVRVSSSTFIDGQNLDVKNFRQKFMTKYGKMPNSDSFLGFDCALYVGKMLMQYGTAFPQNLQNEPQSVLHTRFQFAPIYRAVMSEGDLNDNTFKVENKYVNILRYQAGAFRSDD